FVPPSFPLGADPKLSVFDNWVANATSDCLNPVVPALAMLLPSTVIAVSFSDRPLSDVLSAVVRPIMTPPEAGGEETLLIPLLCYRPPGSQIRCLCCNRAGAHGERDRTGIPITTSSRDASCAANNTRTAIPRGAGHRDSDIRLPSVSGRKRLS